MRFDLSPRTPTKSSVQCGERYSPLPVRLLDDPHLTAVVKTTAAKLGRIAWQSGSITWTTPYLAAALRISPRTLQRHLFSLLTNRYVVETPDFKSPSHRRLILTWLTPVEKSAGSDPIEHRQYLRAPIPAPPVLDRGCRDNLNPEKEEDLRQRSEAEPVKVSEATPEPVETVPNPLDAQEATQEPQHAIAQPNCVQSPLEVQDVTSEASDNLNLTPDEKERLEELPAKAREEILSFLKTGAPILIKEARSRLKPAPQAAPEPTTTEDLIRRASERPDYQPKLASALQLGLRDHAPKQWHFWIKVARQIAARLVPPEEVLRLLGYALQTPKPAHYFATSWKRLGLSP